MDRQYSLKKPLMLIDIEYELAQNRRLDAVKMLKDHTNYPLRDCKNIIDGYINNGNWLHMPGTRVVYDHNRLEYFNRKKNYNASKDDIETLMQRVRPDEKYMIMSMRKETKGMMPGPNMEKVIWKYEQHCKWLSDEFSIEELIKILVADVV